MDNWEPASPFEEQLLAACRSEDLATCLSLLSTTQLALPISEAAVAGTEAPRWATVEHQDTTYILAYTSLPSMVTSTSGAAAQHRSTTLVELAARWPDLQWGLAINPGLPVELLLTSATLARLAAPPLSDEQAISAAPLTPVQKTLVCADVLDRITRGDDRVSGYVHMLADVGHISSPDDLIDALGQSAQAQELLDDGSIYLLRWGAFGAALYRSPYGSTSEVGRAAVDGWVIEEPPFVGTGFVPRAKQVIREFKVDGVALPYGSEIVELDTAGVETLRAVWDGDREAWIRLDVVRTEQAARDTDVPAEVSSDRWGDQS